MGVDLYMRDREAAENAGAEPHYHLTWGGMELIQEVLIARGAMDGDSAGPILPPNADDLSDEEYDRVYDFAFQRWEAEQLNRASAQSPYKVPAVKFDTNHGFIVTPRECRSMAEALRSVSVEDMTAAFEADKDNMESWRAWNEHDIFKQVMGEPPSFEQHMEDLTEMAYEFARYLDRAAEFQGVRVR